jgi:uncharacterized protein YukJ
MMSLKNYHLVIGKPIEWALDDDDSPHIEVLLDVANEKFRAAINVRSKVPPHTLVFKRIQPFNHLLTDSLKALSEGTYDLKGQYAHLALDYVRNDMVQREMMEELPYSISGPNNDLKDNLVPMVETAIASPHSIFYIFGETWGPEVGRPDKYFHFTPGRGIHDIHMNQGSQGSFAQTNGINQDGALIIQQNGIWTAVFLAFSTQSWTTDEQGNHEGELIIPTPPAPPLPGSVISGPIRIIAALVNPFNPEAGKESVTLLNLSDKSIRLDGWRLQDGNNRSELLDGLDIGAGDTLRVRLSGHSMLLKNKDGGKIRLISPDDILVQEVVYQKEDVRREGWSLVI